MGFSAFSQNKDYLVKHNGDTLVGLVELINKTFRVTGSTGKVTQLNAADIKKVHSINFKYNTVVPCKLHTYTEELTELHSYHFVSHEIDTVLVLDEVYQTPKMNLYWGKDNFKRQYYFYKTPSDPLPVQLFINYALGGGQTAKFEKIDVWGQEAIVHVEVQKGYVNQLRFIMGDCKNISEEEWDLLDYRIYSLKALIKNYNKCN